MTVSQLKGLSISSDPNAWIKSLFVFFCFFPYLKVVPFLDTDIQPYALGFSILLFAIWFPFYVNVALLPGLALAFFAIATIGLNGLSVVGLRNSFGYLSFFTITYASYKYLTYRGEPPFRFMTIAIYIWMAVGVIQLFSPEFLNFLLPRAKTSFTRGVFALSPEPTFYGITCLFFLLIVQLAQHPKRKLLSLLLLFQIVFLAQSSMVILFLLILITIRITFKLSLKRFLAYTLVGIISLLILLNIDLGNYNIRFLQIVDLVLDKGFLKLIALDQSISDRAAHIYFSVKGFLESYTLPHGYGEWRSDIKSQLPAYREVFAIDWVSTNDKIMSTYGAALYELGIFGLLLPICISLILYRALRSQLSTAMVMVLFVNMILMTAIPVSFPPLGFLMGLAIYRSKSSDEDTVSP